ncbi:hypothetical protein FQN55_007313 [Onygenales sp. PD_40]|nr:hypothetical protein FQN55_007313 [Onygenales sp. PD_40]KAK2795191.1 hypothetical protein FQN52_006121 [Onygenales sp. PD_12]
MPRPDLNALGVQYRRIPVLVIGRDIYCDTRLILRKLEELYPDGRLGAKDPSGQALEKLLEVWTTDGGVFARATQLIPPDTALTENPMFVKDREDFGGRSFKKKDVFEVLPEAMAYIRQAFEFLETTLLADGRGWVGNTDKPTLADIHAIWPFDWMNGLKGALDRDIISEVHFPRVFAWMSRFRKALSEAESGTSKPTTLSGIQVLDRLGAAEFMEPNGKFDDGDALKLHPGQDVVVWPTDGGSNYKDSGKLVALSAQEVVVQRPTMDNRADIRIHFPRTNFRIVPADSSVSGSRL